MGLVYVSIRFDVQRVSQGKPHTRGQALNVSILGGMLQNDAVLRVMMQNP